MANLVVFTPELNPRIQYTFESLIPALTGCAVKLTNNPAETHQLNYSSEETEAMMQIKPCGLLHSSILQPSVFLSETQQVINGQQDLPAFLFWMAARLEEYAPFSADSHGRFPSTASQITQSGLHLKPLAEILAKDFVQALGIHTAALKVQKILTVDIDCPRLFRKGALYKMLQIMKHTLSGNPAGWKYLWTQQDPWYIFKELQSQFPAIDIYMFCLMSDLGGFDQGSSDIQLWKKIDSDTAFDVFRGIHPSYHSNDSPAVMDGEINRYLSVFGKPPMRSRQHYLKLSLPETYRKLVATGISEDYTMGWADQVGFRAGISVPYPWFDAAMDKELPLTIVPFCAMDVTLKAYMNLTIEDAGKVLNELYHHLPSGGKFITLWHNESLSGYGHWKGWDQLARDVYNPSQTML